MNPAGIQHLEDGTTRNPRYDTVEKLAEKLDVTSDYLGGAGPDLPFERAAVLQALERFKRTEGSRFAAFNDALNLAAEDPDAPHTVAGWRAFMSMSARAWGKRPAPAKVMATTPSTHDRRLRAVDNSRANRTVELSSSDRKRSRRT